MNKIKLPSNIYMGCGSIEALAEILEGEHAKRVLIFSDCGVVGSGLLEPKKELLEKAAVTYTLLSDLAAEPSYLQVQQTVDAAADAQMDIILAVGGGSVMDAATLVSVLHGANYTVKELLDDPAQAKKTVKTIMVPTTCGTGSEATCNAIVAVPEEQVKKGIVNLQMIPDYVILDANMIRRLPPAIVAATGVDALAHCVECYTSNKATPLSNTYAADGARLLFRNIRLAYLDPDNMKAKSAMMLGAYYGGAAITGSGTTAVHALSYPLGGKFHVAHGVSNVILFAHVMEFNRDACQRQLAELYDMIFTACGERSLEEKSIYVINEIASIVKELNIPTDLSAYGVTMDDLEFLVNSGSQQTRLLQNNCKQLSLEDIRGLYLRVLR